MIYDTKGKEFKDAKKQIDCLDKTSISEKVFHGISEFASVRFVSKCMIVEPDEKLDQPTLVSKINEVIHNNVEKKVASSIFTIMSLTNGRVMIEVRGLSYE